MVKVKITRDCAIKGKHYGAGDMTEVIEKDRDLLIAIGKAVAHDGKPEPKNDEEGKEVVDQVVDIRTMLNDFDISAVLSDVSASTSTTVKGIFSNESEEVDVGDIQVEVTEPQPLIV